MGFDTGGTSAATPSVMLNSLVICALICQRKDKSTP